MSRCWLITYRQNRQCWHYLRLVSKKFYLPVYDLNADAQSTVLIYRNKKATATTGFGYHVISYDANKTLVCADLESRIFTSTRDGVKVIIDERVNIIRGGTRINIFSIPCSSSRIDYMHKTMSRLAAYKYATNRYGAVWNVMVELASDEFWNWIKTSMHYLLEEEMP